MNSPDQTPDSNLRSNLESPLIRVLVLIACLLMAFLAWRLFMDGYQKREERVWGELRAYDRAKVEAIEDRYDIRVDAYTFTSPGEWTIDGTDYVCTLNEPTEDLAARTIACVPAEDFTDFGDLQPSS